MKWADPEHKLIAEKIDTMQKTFDRFYEDFKDDTRARGNMEVDIRKVAVVQDAIREDFSDQTRAVERAASDGVEQAIKPVDDKVSKIAQSKQSVIHYIEDHRRGRFGFLKFWKRGEN